MSRPPLSSHRRNEPWRANERHYCAVCNVWMGSDRPSIALHENGRKHREQVELSLTQRRDAKAQQDQAAARVQQSVRQMEAAATQALYTQDLARYATQSSYDASSNVRPVTALCRGNLAPSAPGPSAVPLPTPSVVQSAGPLPTQQEWESRKQQRQEEKARHQKRKQQEHNDDSDGSNEANPTVAVTSKRQRVIATDEGHYSWDGGQTVYLEGVVFGELLEADMPVQLWTGSATANAAEQRLPERAGFWRNALVVRVRPRPLSTSEAARIVTDVAYLAAPNDVDETIETAVPLNRLRIILGADESIPDTLEEARLVALGGETIVPCTSEPSTVDETTGLSSWSTVAIKRTTVHNELREERERLRQQRQQAATAAEKARKETEARKMEEAKVSNADDSALGAYDVWSRGNRDGYKGVDIHGEAKVEVHELGKKLADGKAKVGFKKSAFRSKTKKQNVRTTSADDD